MSQFNEAFILQPTGASNSAPSHRRQRHCGQGTPEDVAHGKVPPGIVTT